MCNFSGVPFIVSSGGRVSRARSIKGDGIHCVGLARYIVSGPRGFYKI